jgi:CubicO group peptidase (beta-lactamase class C family)
MGCGASNFAIVGDVEPGFEEVQQKFASLF